MKRISSVFLMSFFSLTLIMAQPQKKVPQKANQNTQVTSNSNSSAQVKGAFTDVRDGKIYKTVEIGGQTWMAENLAFKADSGCWAYNDSAIYVATYGYLYDWETAKNVCPTGWHLPNGEIEWALLYFYLGNDSLVGGKLKETGTTHWISPNEGATNETGFTALPGGARDNNGSFTDIGGSSIWWSATEDDATGAYFLGLFYNYSNVISSHLDKKFGFSVRCKEN